MKMRPILRLITGAAGTGKTSRCIGLFRDRILASGGSGLISASYFILPNQEHTDRIHDLLTRDARVAGLVQHHLLPIGDFMRFKCWTGRDRVVSQLERRWLTRLALDSRVWKWMTQSAGTPGMGDKLANFVREWKAAGARAGSMAEAGRILAAAGSDPDKLADLRDFVDAYESMKRAEGFRDPEEMVDEFAAQETAAQTRDLDLLVLDGFFSLTEQQILFLRAAAERCSETVVTLTLPELRGREGAFLYPLRLRERLLAIGFAEERIDAEPRRFRSAGLATLERGIFIAEPGDPGDEAAAEAEARSKASGVRRIEAATRRQEVEAIAREMVRNVRGGRCHWSDQMVVLRAMAAYQPYIEEVFGAMGVPYELHERRRLAEHPSVRKMSEWLELIETPEPEGSEPLIRIHRWALWMNSGTTIGELDALPARLEWGQVPEQLPELDPSSQALWQRERARMKHFLALRSAADLKRFLENLLEDCCGAAALAGTRRARELVRDLIERQTVRPAEGAGQVRAAVARLRNDLEAGLYSVSARRKNRVQVYDTALALPKEYRVVYVAGLNHGEFPAEHREDAVLRDKERGALRAGGIFLDTAEDRRKGEAFFFYMAVTRASEEVVLTRFRADDQGRPTAASAWWTAAGEVLGKALVTETVGSEDLVPAASGIRSAAELLRALGAGIGDRIAGGLAQDSSSSPVSGSLDQAWDRLSAAERLSAGCPHDSRALTAAAAKLRGPYTADLTALDPAGNDRRKPWSATEAQTLLQCRFKYFVQYGVGIRPAARTTPVMREGELWHKALEVLMRRFSGRPVPARAEFMKEAGPALETAFREHPLIAERFYMREARAGRIRRRWPLVAAAEWENWKRSHGIAPALFEADFGLVKDGRPSAQGPFAVTAAGERLEFCGQIDRIDADPATGRALAADYKSGKDFVYKDLEKGMLFQSVLYTLALREVWGYEPIGLEYVSLKTFRRAGLLREDLYREARPLTRLKSLMEPAAFESLIDRSLAMLVDDWKKYRSGDIAADARSCRNCDHYSLCRYEKRKANL